MTFALDLVLRTTGLLLVAVIASRALGQASAAVRHLLWISVLGAAMLLPALAIFLPDLDLPLLPGVESRDGRVVEGWIWRIPPPHFSQSGEMLSDEPAGFAWTRWILVLGTLGAGAVLMRSAVGIYQVQRLKHSCRPLDESHWQKLLDDIQVEIGVSLRVHLRLGAHSLPPMAWGFFHHTILLPGEALAWSAERLRLVIAHELAHIRRRDALTQVIVQLASAMYWFNPLVWYAAYRIREERERASDDCVLGLGIEGSDYAHHLLQIARDVARASLPSTVAMAHRSNLEDRLRAILENHRDRRPPSLRTAVTGMTAVLVATTLLANLQLTARSATPTALTAEAESPKAGPSPEVRAAQALQIPPVYRTWLNEDVLYIIATEEKAAFLSLQSDEERNLFIDQFWSHRDPTPATPTNEFREEHYQRIAYANARFGAASKPGWQTDRGRLYILHGKPDELDSHPNAGAVRHPYEIWTYKYVEGIGNNVAVEFVDSTGNGDYRLAANPDEKFQAATPVNGPPQFSFRFLQAAAAAQPFTLHLPFALSFAPSAATLRFKYSDLAFQTAGGTHTARLHLLGEVVNSVGAPALHFEDSIEKPVPDFLFSQTLQTEGVYRKPLSLTSGEYRLSVVVEDLNSGRLGMATITMRIP